MSEMAVHGGLCWLAGQVAADATQDIAGQTRQVLAAVDALLARAGMDRTKIAMCQIYLADIADFAALNAVWDGRVPAGHAPLRATARRATSRGAARSPSRGATSAGTGAASCG